MSHNVLSKIASVIAALTIASCAVPKPDVDRVRETIKLQIEKEGCLVLKSFAPDPMNGVPAKDQETYKFNAIIDLLEPKDCIWEAPGSYGYDDPENFRSKRMSMPDRDRNHQVHISIFLELKESAWQMVGYKFNKMQRQR